MFSAHFSFQFSFPNYKLFRLFYHTFSMSKGLKKSHRQEIIIPANFPLHREGKADHQAVFPPVQENY